MITAAIYARRSNEQRDRDDADKSVHHQIARARAYIAEKGWALDEASIFIDDGISGAEFSKRPGLVSLLRSLDQKPRARFQVLVMQDESRLGRDTIRTAYALTQIVEADVRVFFYLDDRERTLDSPIDKIMLSVTTFADEMKRVKDGQTVYDKVSAKARQGHVVGSSVFGYDNVPVSGPSGKRSHVSRVINPAQAGIVRRILELSETGMGLTRIAKLLNADGAPAPKPKRGRDPGWSASTVREILNRRLYLGEVVWGRTKKRDKHGRLKLSRRPPEEWIRTKDETLRIVSDEQWSRTHNRLARVREQMRAMGGGARKLRTRDVESPFLLTGFARCAECGSSLGVLSGGRARKRVYGCVRAHKTGLCENRLRLPIERVDDAVLHAIVDQVLTETVVEAVVDRVMKKLAPTTVAQSVTDLRTALQGVEIEISNVTKAIAHGGELDSLLDKLRECEKRRNAFRADIVGRERIQGRHIDRTALEAGVRRRVDDWRGLLERRPEQSRQLLREMLAGPIRFTPVGDVYQFRGEASFGILAGEASGTTLVVPVRGIEPRFQG